MHVELIAITHYLAGDGDGSRASTGGVSLHPDFHNLCPIVPVLGSARDAEHRSAEVLGELTDGRADEFDLSVAAIIATLR